jgi:molybdopterin converting factor small subunit
MATVWIPPLLQDLTDGKTRLQVTGETVREVLEHLEQDFPGISERLCQDDRIKPGIAVVVDSEVSTRGLRQRLSETSEVHFLPAISGG